MKSQMFSFHLYLSCGQKDDSKQNADVDYSLLSPSEVIEMIDSCKL